MLRSLALNFVSFSLQKYPVHSVQCFLRQINRVLSVFFSLLCFYSLSSKEDKSCSCEADHDCHADAEG